jgi:hypothetical protein
VEILESAAELGRDEVAVLLDVFEAQVVLLQFAQ